MYCTSDLHLEVKNSDPSKLDHHDGKGFVKLENNVLSQVCFIGGVFGLVTDVSVSTRRKLGDNPVLSARVSVLDDGASQE